MGSAGKAAGNLLKDGTKALTVGMYNPDTGGFQVGSGQAQTFADGFTASDTRNTFTPEIPKAPQAEDPATQAARAQAEAEAKAKSEVSKGLSATVLGGSTSADSSILKKKKLLGE